MFDTEKVKEELKRLAETGLFDDFQLETARIWLREYQGKVYASPNKAALIVDMANRYVLELCQKCKIDHERTLFGHWLVPVDELIRLRKRVIDRKGGKK